MKGVNVLEIKALGSGVIKLNETKPDFYFTDGDEWYLPLTVFFNHFNKVNGTVILPGCRPVKPIIYQGRRVVKLSDLGLKLAMKDNVAWLEWN